MTTDDILSGITSFREFLAHEHSRKPKWLRPVAPIAMGVICLNLVLALSGTLNEHPAILVIGLTSTALAMSAMAFDGGFMHGMDSCEERAMAGNGETEDEV